MKKGLQRSAIILIILALSVGIGFLCDTIGDKLDRKAHPLQYTEFVEQYAFAYGVPKEIVYAVIKVESGFQSNAVSHRGAVGLMQIMPDTFDWLMMRQKESIEQGLLYDPETNIRYGTYFLSLLYSEFSSWDIVYAAYNAGMGKAKEWLQDEQYTKDGVLVEIPFKETKEYVEKVKKAVTLYQKLYFE